VARHLSLDKGRDLDEHMNQVLAQQRKALGGAANLHAVAEDRVRP
jgi:hypothetical protein